MKNEAVLIVMLLVTKETAIPCTIRYLLCSKTLRYSLQDLFNDAS